MSFKTLLVHAEPDWGSDDALTAAMHVASLFNAHIVGIGAEALDPANYAFGDGSVVQMLRDQLDIDLASAERRFMAAVEGNSAGATFISGMDRPHVLLARHVAKL